MYKWINWGFLPGLHCSPQNTWVRRSETKKPDQGAWKEKVTVCDRLSGIWFGEELVTGDTQGKGYFFQVHIEWSVKLMAYSHKIITNISAADLHLWVCTRVKSWQIKGLRDLLWGPTWALAAPQGSASPLHKSLFCCKNKGHWALGVTADLRASCLRCWGGRLVVKHQEKCKLKDSSEASISKAGPAHCAFKSPLCTEAALW